MGLAMATRKAVETHVDAIVFIPPKSTGEKGYGLLKALSVHGQTGGTAEFTTLRCGISEEFVAEYLPDKVPEVKKYLNTDAEDIDSFDDVIEIKEAMSGTLGAKIKLFFQTLLSLGTESASAHTLRLTNLKEKAIEQLDSKSIAFLQACLPHFCTEAREIVDVFGRTPTRFSGSIDYGLAFVTTCITGHVNIQEMNASHVKASLTAMSKGAEVGGEAAVDSSVTGELIGSGAIGAVVYFFHLSKTRISTEPYFIKDQFGIKTTNDHRLKDLLGTWAAKILRKVKEPNGPPSRAVAMAEGYNTSGSVQQDIEALEALADEEAVECVFASLRVVGETEDDQNVSTTPRQGYFSRSNNLLIKGTVEEFERIRKDIGESETQTTTIHGKVVDAIKPAINVKISGALPILYKQELSGTPPPDDNVPGWVLWAVPGGQMFMLWAVYGVEGDGSMNSGIVSAYDETNWHVRECIEYIDGADTDFINELKGQGFLEMDPSEADPEKVAMVENGSVVMMGLHLLALKSFKHDEEEVERMESVDWSAL